jgi:hypothetical protein
MQIDCLQMPDGKKSGYCRRMLPGSKMQVGPVCHDELYTKNYKIYQTIMKKLQDAFQLKVSS